MGATWRYEAKKKKKKDSKGFGKDQCNNLKNSKHDFTLLHSIFVEFPTISIAVKLLAAGCFTKIDLLRQGINQSSRNRRSFHLGFVLFLTVIMTDVHNKSQKLAVYVGFQLTPWTPSWICPSPHTKYQNWKDSAPAGTKQSESSDTFCCPAEKPPGFTCGTFTSFIVLSKTL